MFKSKRLEIEELCNASQLIMYASLNTARTFNLVIKPTLRTRCLLCLEYTRPMRSLISKLTKSSYTFHEDELSLFNPTSVEQIIELRKICLSIQYLFKFFFYKSRDSIKLWAKSFAKAGVKQLSIAVIKTDGSNQTSSDLNLKQSTVA